MTTAVGSADAQDEGKVEEEDMGYGREELPVC